MNLFFLTKTQQRGTCVFDGAVETIRNVPKLSIFNPSTSPEWLRPRLVADSVDEGGCFNPIFSLHYVKTLFEYSCRGINL